MLDKSCEKPPKKRRDATVRSFLLSLLLPLSSLANSELSSFQTLFHLRFEPPRRRLSPQSSLVLTSLQSSRQSESRPRSCLTKTLHSLLLHSNLTYIFSLFSPADSVAIKASHPLARTEISSLLNASTLSLLSVRPRSDLVSPRPSHLKLPPSTPVYPMKIPRSFFLERLRVRSLSPLFISLLRLASKEAKHRMDQSEDREPRF